jgi:hypothetical protein
MVVKKVFSLSLSLFSIFLNSWTVLAQDSPHTRVEIATISAEDAAPQIEAALRAAGSTMELTLQLLGRYTVTTDFSFAWPDLASYVTSLELGTVDRIIVMEGSQTERGLVLEATVINPLDGSVEIQRREELRSILGLFDAVDRISAGLIGELAGERIAFGALKVELDGWDLEPLLNISLHGMPVLGEPSNPPAESDYSISIDGVSPGDGLRAERVLIGEHVLRVHDEKAGRIVAQQTVSVEEERQFQATFAVPLLSEQETVTLAEAVAAVNTARSEWNATGMETALRQWEFSLQELTESQTAATLRREVVDLEYLAIDVAEIDWEMRSSWKEPNEHWVTRLSTAATSVGATELASPVVEEIAAAITGLVSAVPQLQSLAAVAALRDNDVSRMEQLYGADVLPDLPPWFMRDRGAIEQFLEEFHTGQRERRGLYRALKVGGIGMALGGGVTWGMGFDSSAQADDLYDEYRTADEVESIRTMREEIETKDAQGQLLQGGGIALSATGIASFVAGSIMERRDRIVPERLLRARLEGYFSPRIDLYEALTEQEFLETLPIPEFSETITAL